MTYIETHTTYIDKIREMVFECGSWINEFLILKVSADLANNTIDLTDHCLLQQQKL
jgi:hypothetical protein